ncbi:hypothetical protein ScPMuIL_003557 [Solemya velum]
MYAICIWIDDDVMGGSVVQMNKMMMASDPNRPVNPYDLKPGDLVKAPCHGFPGNDVKKELRGIIDSPAFLEMVRRYASKHKVNFDSTVSSAQNVPDSDVESDSTMITKMAKKRNLKKKEENVSNRKKLSEPEVKKKKTEPACSESQIKKAEENQRKKIQKKVEEAAKELELTELEAVISNSSTCSNELEGLDSSYVVECLPSHSEESVKNKCSSMSSLVRDSLELTYNTQENSCQSCLTLEGKISQLENTCNTLWNWNKQIQQEQFNLHQHIQQLQQTLNQQFIQMQHQKPAEEPQQSTLSTCSNEITSPIGTTPIEQNQEGTVNTPKNEERVVAGYTMTQLELKCSHLESFSKVATLLFRTLFKNPEEYIGKTLTGASGKPAVDQEKLGVVYEITKKKFPGITSAMIRCRLSDILKPSRQNLKKI